MYEIAREVRVLCCPLIHCPPHPYCNANEDTPQSMPLFAPTAASLHRSSVVKDSIDNRRQSEAVAQRKSIIASPPSRGVAVAQASSRFDALVLEWVNQTAKLPAFDRLDILSKVSSALEIKADVFGVPVAGYPEMASSVASPTSPYSKSITSQSAINGHRSPSPGTTMGTAAMRVKQSRQASRNGSTPVAAKKVESPEEKRKRALAEVRAEVAQRMEELEREAQEEYECRMRGEPFERKQKAPKRRRVPTKEPLPAHADPVVKVVEPSAAVVVSSISTVDEEAAAEPVAEEAAAEPVAEEAAAEPVAEEAAAEPVAKEAAAEPVAEEAAAEPSSEAALPHANNVGEEW